MTGENKLPELPQAPQFVNNLLDIGWNWEEYKAKILSGQGQSPTNGTSQYVQAIYNVEQRITTIEAVLSSYRSDMNSVGMQLNSVDGRLDQHANDIAKLYGLISGGYQGGQQTPYQGDLSSYLKISDAIGMFQPIGQIPAHNHNASDILGLPTGGNGGGVQFVEWTDQQLDTKVKSLGYKNIQELQSMFAPLNHSHDVTNPPNVVSPFTTGDMDMIRDIMTMYSDMCRYSGASTGIQTIHHGGIQQGGFVAPPSGQSSQGTGNVLVPSGPAGLSFSPPTQLMDRLKLLLSTPWEQLINQVNQVSGASSPSQLVNSVVTNINPTQMETMLGKAPSYVQLITLNQQLMSLTNAEGVKELLSLVNDNLTFLTKMKTYGTATIKTYEWVPVSKVSQPTGGIIGGIGGQTTPSINIGAGNIGSGLARPGGTVQTVQQAGQATGIVDSSGTVYELREVTKTIPSEPYSLKVSRFAEYGGLEYVESMIANAIATMKAMSQSGEALDVNSLYTILKPKLQEHIEKEVPYISIPITRSEPNVPFKSMALDDIPFEIQGIKDVMSQYDLSYQGLFTDLQAQLDSLKAASDLLAGSALTLESLKDPFNDAGDVLEGLSDELGSIKDIGDKIKELGSLSVSEINTVLGYAQVGSDANNDIANSVSNFESASAHISNGIDIDDPVEITVHLYHALKYAISALSTMKSSVSQIEGRLIDSQEQIKATIDKVNDVMSKLGSLSNVGLSDSDKTKFAGLQSIGTVGGI